MIPAPVAFGLIAVLLTIRGVAAAQLPLSADEAYYWLWSQHLAAGYYDHPPMIAWLIRAGTTLFGDTPLGVRFAGVVLSLPATWFVWRSAVLLLKDEDRAATAALFFNLTLMVSVEMLAATPDMPSLTTSTAFLYFLTRVQARDDRSAWLSAGIAAGLGLLSKFSALFLGAGALVWLLADRNARKWLLTPWPYLGAILALLIFAPNLIWQSQHHWQTFAFQFGRVSGGELTLFYLCEFLAAQFGLATPLMFALMAVGLWFATRWNSDRLLLAALVWTGLGYFLVHSLHDRVQGNWPAFLYPALAILAVDALGMAQGIGRKVSRYAAPLAAVLLLTIYAQALYAPLPLAKDPLARILGRHFAPIGDVAAALVKSHLADAVLTTDYGTTAWLRFNQPGVKVIQLTDTQRFVHAPAADAKLLQRPLIYLTEFRRDQHHAVQKLFSYTGFPTQLQTPTSFYMVYPVRQPKSSPLGRMP
ncbi:MAG TPA: glycosyltransferase family 39 protein [Rhizomicrobium sp.]|nr:glycosyltransferase family 39 protein [Rhizomicrobium sp.]